jgi:hypothetical protein
MNFELKMEFIVLSLFPLLSHPTVFSRFLLCFIFVVGENIGSSLYQARLQNTTRRKIQRFALYDSVDRKTNTYMYLVSTGYAKEILITDSLPIEPLFHVIIGAQTSKEDYPQLYTSSIIQDNTNFT